LRSSLGHAKVMRLSRGRGIWFKIEARLTQRAAKAEPRPRQAKRCLEVCKAATS